MLQEMWNAPPGFRPTKSAPSSPAKPLGISRTRSEAFHVAHKVPVGDSPYVRAKNVQLVDKDPERAIPLFWAAINAGDRVDSALKDMAIVMKQQNRAEEAVEAIKSLRSRCSDQAQEALDNILLDLYKRCGRLDDQICLLRHKLFLIQQGMAFNGKRTKTARSQGKKFQVSVEQEATRLLGNLGWALMQQNNYVEAEDAYRRALLIAPDNNKMCNLGICLMKQGRIGEAKDNLRKVKPAQIDGPRGVDSHLKAYERAQQMLRDLESEMMNKGGEDRVEQSKLFESFLGSSAIWQPQPCREQGGGLLSTSSSLDSSKQRNDEYANENINSNNVMIQKVLRPILQKPLNPNGFNIDAPPFYSSKLSQDHPETLKRTRSSDAAGCDAANSVTFENLAEWKMPTMEPENKVRKQSISPRKDGDTSKKESISPRQEGDKSKFAAELFLPDSKDFEDAIINAVLSSSDTPKNANFNIGERKLEKRLRVFQDITQSLSPRA